MTEEVFNIPLSGYKQLEGIINAFLSVENEATADEIHTISSIPKHNIQRNLPFLTAVDILESLKTKKWQLTAFGKRLGQAIESNNQDEVSTCWREIFDKVKFFQSVLQIVQVQKIVNQTDLIGNIIHLAGKISYKKYSRVEVGAKTIIDILERAGYLTTEYKNKIKVVRVLPITAETTETTTLLRAINSLHPKIVERCYKLFKDQHYDAAIFEGMKDVEETIRSKANLLPTDIGTRLIDKAFNPQNPLIEVSQIPAEQESAHFLFRGAIGYFKNPRSHRSPQASDPIFSFECLALASLLLSILDGANFIQPPWR